jgi:small subunit ribosomal protein S17
MSKKILIGKIVSTKTALTAKVDVSRTKKHPKYHKQFSISKNYLVHNPENKFKTGQIVEIQETTPISKNKKFIILKQVKD